MTSFGAPESSELNGPSTKRAREDEPDTAQEPPSTLELHMDFDPAAMAIALHVHATGTVAGAPLPQDATLAWLRREVLARYGLPDLARLPFNPAAAAEGTLLRLLSFHRQADAEAAARQVIKQLPVGSLHSRDSAVFKVAPAAAEPGGKEGTGLAVTCLEGLEASLEEPSGAEGYLAGAARAQLRLPARGRFPVARPVELVHPVDGTRECLDGRNPDPSAWDAQRMSLTVPPRPLCRASAEEVVRQLTALEPGLQARWVRVPVLFREYQDDGQALAAALDEQALAYEEGLPDSAFETRLEEVALLLVRWG